ncbi:MAG: diphthamide biosynthesis enzyme Dph2 [Candidatus Aenigmatarchaeota archaeon]|nr:MAG: diphthamide biosynthesis enzyme Dph2 [Candidatus Aenigmarchaeota archaeon]
MFDEKAIGSLVDKVAKKKPRRVFLQYPEGLKLSIFDISEKLERLGAEVFISCDPCFGSCDMKDLEAKALGCDLLVHIGHTEMKLPRKTAVPAIYEDYRIDIDPTHLLDEHIQALGPCESICLVTTAQYISAIEPAKRFLEEHGKKVYVGQPSLAKHPGQILGCDHSAAEPFDNMVDCFLFLGTGRFHPLGLAAKVKKTVLVLDFETSVLENMNSERDMMVRIKTMQIEKAKEMKRFGVLVSTKPGQSHPGTAEKVKKRLKGKGKDARILVMDQITPEKILGMKIDALVNCSCPRLSEDFRQFKKPILDPEDVDRL